MLLIHTLFPKPKLNKCIGYVEVGMETKNKEGKQIKTWDETVYLYVKGTTRSLKPMTSSLTRDEYVTKELRHWREGGPEPSNMVHF